MADLIFGLEEVSMPVAGRSRARLTYRGGIRKQIRQLKKKLQNIIAFDFREDARSARLGYTPALFQGSGNSAVKRAIVTLIERCNATLAEKY